MFCLDWYTREWGARKHIGLGLDLVLTQQYVREKWCCTWDFHPFLRKDHSILMDKSPSERKHVGIRPSDRTSDLWKREGGRLTQVSQVVSTLNNQSLYSHLVSWRSFHLPSSSVSFLHWLSFHLPSSRVSSLHSLTSISRPCIWYWIS